MAGTISPFAFTPPNGWRDTSGYPEVPADETAARALLQQPHDQLMAYVNKLAKGIIPYVTLSTSDNVAYTGTPDPSFTAYGNGLTVMGYIGAAGSSNGQPTINLNGLGAKSVVDTAGLPINFANYGTYLLTYLTVWDKFVAIVLYADNQIRTGWNVLPDGTYVSATQLTIPGNWTSILKKYDKIACVNSGQKYFFLYPAPTYAGGVTTLTVYGGSDFSLANAAITSLMFSKAENPTGFPETFNYVPTFSAENSMTFTGVAITKACFWIAEGKAHVLINASGTTGGTVSTGVKATLPFNVHADANDMPCAGRVSDGGNTLAANVWVQNSDNCVYARKYDSSNFAAGSGRRMIVAPIYQPA